MHINIDFARISDHLITFNIAVPAPIHLQFDALVVGNGIKIKYLTCDAPFTFDENILVLTKPCQLQYELHTVYRDVVGDDREVYVMYPFINEREVFFGVGAVPYPLNYAEVADEFTFSCELHHVPAGWQVFSTLDSPAPGQLEGFFVYAVANEIEAGSFVCGDTTFQWMKQPGKIFPLAGEEIETYITNYVNWLEANIGPFLPDSVNLLFLQAPSNFADLTNHRTFATGQNFSNGILTAGPNSPDYLQAMFGYDDYRFFLYDGITHELMHYYTTTSWQGKYKAYLYPATDASPYTCRLIGEALNIYFHRQYLYQYWYGSYERFYAMDIPDSIKKAQLRGIRTPLVDLYLLDKALHEGGTSLLEQFRRLVSERKAISTPMALVEELPEQVAAYVDESVVPEYLA